MRRLLASLGAAVTSAVDGAYALGSLGEVDDDPSRWLTTRLALAGMVLAGLVLLVAAATALLRP